MQLTRFDSAVFLRDFWQRKPLLIRNPWQAWAEPLSPDELAGLACEDDAEARIVIREGEGWMVEHGPFSEERFAALPARPWTLLVQAVDHHVPAVAALREPFRFIPKWRIDDVMVSYATDGGGVGPHYDQYDVFLIQGSGRRRWRIGAACDAATALLPHDDLRLLAEFEPVEEWILEPGDILYLPPRIAHDGIAVGDDCMTYSIGFRAPSRSELIAHWCDQVLADLPDDDRYEDPGLAPQDNAGEISAHAIARLHEMVTEKMLDRAAFARWFGRYNSTPKYPEADWSPEEPLTLADLRDGAAGGMGVCCNPASRFSFVRETADRLLLFVDGECFACTGPAAALAERICAGSPVSVDPATMKSTEVTDLLLALCNRGSVAFDDPD